MRWLLLPTLLVLIVAPAARAAEGSSRERTARRACLTGDFTKGVEILADLFLDTGDLTHIFNQGRCLEQNRRYEDAIARFREYLVKGTSLTAEDRADAQKHIAACHSYMEKPEPERAGALPVPTATPVPPPTETTPAPTVRVVDAAPDANPPGHAWRTGGIVAASLGVAALLTGVGLNFKVNSMTDNLEKPNAYDRSTNSTRESYKTAGWVAYGVGGAAVAAGAVLYAIGWSTAHSSSTRPSLALAPSLAASTPGIAVAGGF